MPRILDNIRDALNDALRKTLTVSHRLDASVGYFNLRGWAQLADSVDAMPVGHESPAVRLLVGMADRPDSELRQLLRVVRRQLEIDNQQAAQLRKQAAQDLRDQLTLGIPSSHDEKVLRQLKRQLAEGAVQVRMFLRHRLHAKLYLCHRADYDNPMTGYVGSSNLTFAGLADQGELNVDVLDHDATRKLYQWFEDRWNDRFSIDITKDLIEILEESWAGERLLSPYHLYLKMAYHLSREAREGLLQYGLPESMASQLLEHQASAVRVAARILNRRRGVMIGDVVGLGKTIVATAIALLLQEEEGVETLIVCPKNLVSMWEGYVEHYRLHAKVVSLSMVTRQLPELRRYRVVVIDESHNLRSETRKDYAALKDYIERNDSRVILLTATPYNKRFLDVANQLGLFVDPDANLGIQPDRAIQRIGQTDFLRLCSGKPQTLGAFRKSDEPEDWRRLMSLFLVRRTRKFIRDNYALEEAGKFYLTFKDGRRFWFPERIAMTLPHDLPANDPAALMVADETLSAIDSLLLPRYRLAEYRADGVAPKPDEQSVLGDLALASGNLIGVTRTMLYKRLSSSAAAFLISLQRHLLRNWVYLNAIRNDDLLPVGHVDQTLWDDDQGPDQDELAGDEYLSFDRTGDQWADEAGAAYNVLKRKGSKAVRWIRPLLFTEQLAIDLERDIAILQRLLAEFGTWHQAEDSKLDALEFLLSHRHPTEKVLIFTEYKDTGDYVASGLTQRGLDSVVAVSGSTDDPTLAARRFSPHSNVDIGGLPVGEHEIRVLVTTDVLSEGQNLQDSHVVVNYDLPWAIIKIIQRAGRVDRLGQQSPEVLVYSFLPADDVEHVINLRSRIARRLRENAVAFGSDEAFFGDEGERRVIEGLYHEGEVIDDPGETGEDVDWASTAYEIWRRATDDDPRLAAVIESLPDAVFATRPARSDDDPGVIVYVQSEFGYDALAFTAIDGTSQLLSPYEALLRAACQSDTPALSRLDEHHELVAQAITGPLQSPATHLEGALTGVRKRCWDRLSNYKEKYAGTLFDNERLDRALDELYRKPLRESAVHALANALRERTPEDLAGLIISLHEEDRLCVADRDLDSADLRMISSMGIRRVSS